MRTITVKGTGNVSARPDYIVLSLNIEAISETYDRAMTEASERIKKLQDAAVLVGYEKSDLKTTSFNVQTRYENVKDRQGNYKREFAGYACSYHLKLAFNFDSKCRFVKHIGQQTRREKASGGVSLESCLSDGYG